MDIVQTGEFHSGLFAFSAVLLADVSVSMRQRPEWGIVMVNIATQ